MSDKEIDDSFSPVPMVMSKKFSAKAMVMLSIRDHIEKNKIGKNDAAKTVGTTQSRIGSLMNGEIGEFSLDYLVDAAESLGISVTVNIENIAA